MAQQPIDSVVAEFLVDTGWTPANKVDAVSIINRFSVWCAARELELLTVGKLDIVTFLDERRAAGKAR